MKNSKLKFSEYMQNISRSKSFGKFVLIVYRKCRIIFCCTSWISVPNELFPIQYVTSPNRETSEFCIQLKCNWSATTKKNQRFSTPKKSKHQGAVSESKHYLPWQKAFRILHSIKWPTRSGFLEHAIKIRPRFTLCLFVCFIYLCPQALIEA